MIHYSIRLYLVGFLAGRSDIVNHCGTEVSKYPFDRNYTKIALMNELWKLV